MTQYQLNYSDVDGRLVRVFLPMFFGAFAAGGLWFLYLLVIYPPSMPLAVAAIGLVSIATTWLFGWLASACRGHLPTKRSGRLVAAPVKQRIRGERPNPAAPAL